MNKLDSSTPLIEKNTEHQSPPDVLQNTVEDTQKKVEFLIGKDVLSETVGRILSTKTKDKSSKLSPEEMKDFILHKLHIAPVKQQSTLPPLLVQIGKSSFRNQVKRFYEQQKDTPTHTKLAWTARFSLSKIREKLERESNYDPNTNTLTLFNTSKATALHELGHYIEMAPNPEQYFSKTNTLSQEWDASHNAIKLADNEEEKDILPALQNKFRTYTKRFGHQEDEYIQKKLGSTLQEKEDNNENQFFDHEVHSKFS